MRPTIALATVDGRAYYALTRELKKRGIPFLNVVPGEEVPPEAEVVITTEAERSALRSSKPVVTYRGDAETAIDEAVQTALGAERFEELVVGVDPGKRFGIAILGDGILLRSLSLLDVDEVIREIEYALKTFNAQRRVIRVGDGAPPYRDMLLEKLSLNEVDVELVPETHTTITKLKKDEIAAIRIATKKGKRVR